MTENIGFDEFEAFNVITGLNGSGKTQFLKMLDKGTLNISIDGSPVTDIENKIRYFSYEDFWLSEKNQGQFDVNKELTGFYTELEKLLGFKQVALGVFRKSYGTSQMFTAVQHLLKLAPDERLDSVADYKNEKGYKEATELINNLSKTKLDEALQRNQGGGAMKKVAELSPYLDDDDIWNVSQQQFTAALLKSRGSDYLQEGFSEVFQKYINEQNRFVLEEGEEDRSVADLRDEFAGIYGQAPWTFANEVLSAFSTRNYEFRYRYDKPTGNEKAILRNSLGEEVAESSLSSGEKTVLALTLFVYQNLADEIRFPEVLLLDEIDATLHPRLCERFLGVIDRNIVRDKNTVVFLATHNPSTVANATSNIPVYIKHLPTEKNGSICRVQDPVEALRFLSEGFMTLDQGVRLYQEATNKKYAIVSEGKNIFHIKHAIKILKPEILSDLHFLEGAVGRMSSKQMKTLFNFFSINEIPDEKRIIFVWDWDVEEIKGMGDLKRKGGLIPYIFQRNEKNKIRGIENLYDLDHPGLSQVVCKNSDGDKFLRYGDKDKFLQVVLSIVDKKYFIYYENLINQIEVHE